MNHAEEPRDKLAIKVSEAERDDAVERLKDHYVAGRLTLSELEDRVTIVYQAATAAQLGTITADLPAEGRTSGRASAGTDRQVLILLLCFCPPAALVYWLTTRSPARRYHSHPQQRPSGV
ncbi:DUF1707 domain-containing protein [Streptomyces sp. NPDC093228]|jgi:hypothetical protein|uniref:DUF1707 SHOCT-like domain-containing protein n=1 Tax=Streptomyces sp. NPDC093228 TaxID=3155070 RepID=UPI00342E7E88